MAKKQTNNSINLLRGITGSKLASMIAVIAIVLAIPVTIVSVQQQQNTQQEAARDSGGGSISACNRIGGTCINTKYTKCTNGTLKPNLCSGAKEIKCCIKNGAAIVPSDAKCKSAGGTCVSKSQCGSESYRTGLCPGSLICCSSCKFIYSSGRCQQDWKSCKGGYDPGKCIGGSDIRCCRY